MKWVSLWSYFSEPITTYKLDLACQISNGFTVDLLIYYHKEKRTKLLFFVFLFLFLLKRESYVLSCSISNNESKGYLKLGQYQLDNYDYICLRQHINVAYVWQILPETQSSLTEWRNNIGGYINLQPSTIHGWNVWLYQFITVRCHFKARVLTGYKAWKCALSEYLVPTQVHWKCP